MSTTKTKPATKTANGTATAQHAKEAVSKILTPSASSRIKRLETFSKLANKHTKLIEKKDEMDSFNVSGDGLNEKLILDNGEQQFQISNSQVIARLKLEVEKTLCTLIEDSEKEIVNYNI